MRFFSVVREFQIYDATVPKTSRKIASSSLSIFFVIMSICLTFECWQNNQGTESRDAVLKLGKKIQFHGCLFTLSVKLEIWLFHVADLPAVGKK